MIEVNHNDYTTKPMHSMSCVETEIFRIVNASRFLFFGYTEQDEREPRSFKGSMGSIRGF